MIRLPRRPTIAAISLIVVACFAYAAFESCLEHTDDGCAVELHCFACHWKLASAALTAGLVTVSAGHTASAPVESEPAHAAPRIEIASPTSRGPPIS